MERLIRFSVGHPWVVMALVGAVLVISTWQIRNGSRMETDLDEYMPKDHPAFVYSDLAESWFDIKDGIILAVESKGGIYNAGTLQKVKDLTLALQDDPDIRKEDVTSLFTADNIVSSQDGLDVRRFYRKVPASQEALDTLREQVRGNDMARGRLVSEDETVAVVIARLDDDVFSPEFYERIRSLAVRYEGPERIHVAGRPVVEGTLAELAPRDMQRMVPAVLLVIIVVLGLVLKGARPMVLTLGIVVVSTVASFGLMAATGIPIYSVTTMMPVMLIAIGIADGIHLFNHLYEARRSEPESPLAESVVHTLRELWRPVLMTSVTTAVGFLSLLTSEVYPIKYFGIFTAFGVMVAMVLSLTLIPAGTVLLGIARRKTPGGPHEARSFLDRAARAILSNRRPILVLTLALTLLSAFGMSRLWIDSSFLEKFEKDSAVVQTDAFVNEHFGGTTTLNVILEAATPGTFKQPAPLAAVLDMEKEVAAEDGVGSSFSITDYLRRMNLAMHEDRTEFDTLPESEELAAQYLLLYEMSGDPQNLWRVVNYDYNRASVTFQIKGDYSKMMRGVIDTVEHHRDDLEAQGIQLNYAGSGYKALVFSGLILEGQVSSIALSMVILVVLLWGMFRSLRLGIIGTIPIALTTLVSFGVMGLLDIPLSTTTALLASITVGIGIDFAIHFIDRYRINLRSQADKTLALLSTLKQTGRAILFNALVVIAGFLVLLLSQFPPNRALGALVALGMFTSFMATVTVTVHLLKGGAK